MGVVVDKVDSIEYYIKDGISIDKEYIGFSIYLLD